MKIIPKHIESGKKLKMRMGQRGEAYMTLLVVNEDNNQSEEAEFLIDTGFNGYLQLEENFIKKLDIKLINKQKTKGFDGIEKEVGTSKTKIKILDTEIPGIPIQFVNNGAFLIGTNLLKALSQMIIIDYHNGVFTITSDKKVQKKVHKNIEKYSK